MTEGRELSASLTGSPASAGLPDAMLAEMTAWCGRFLDRSYPVLLIDAIPVGGSGHPALLAHVAFGVGSAGNREVLGLWAAEAGQDRLARWRSDLRELRYRGVVDVRVVCTAGLGDISGPIRAAWPAAAQVDGVSGLVHETLLGIAHEDWPQIGDAMRAIYVAAAPDQVADATARFAARWAARYPAVARQWTQALASLAALAGLDRPLREAIYVASLNASLTAALRAAAARPDCFPDARGALAALYLLVRNDGWPASPAAG